MIQPPQICDHTRQQGWTQETNPPTRTEGMSSMLCLGCVHDFVLLARAKCDYVNHSENMPHMKRTWIYMRRRECAWPQLMCVVFLCVCVSSSTNGRHPRARINPNRTRTQLNHHSHHTSPSLVLFHWDLYGLVCLKINFENTKGKNIERETEKWAHKNTAQMDDPLSYAIQRRLWKTTTILCASSSLLIHGDARGEK